MPGPLSIISWCMGMLALPLCGSAQQQDSVWLATLASYWAAIDSAYADSTRSPLLPADRTTFNGLERFGPDTRYRVIARFRAKQGRDFGMPTTTDRRPMYHSVGTLTFSLHGRKHRLTVFRNRELAKRPEYTNHLFVPFTDLSNGEGTYGGGRYLDLEGPLGKQVELDLNRAYNPYCAYGGNYSCPIPPPENHLNIRVEAGVRAFDH